MQGQRKAVANGAGENALEGEESLVCVVGAEQGRLLQHFHTVESDGGWKSHIITNPKLPNWQGIAPMVSTRWQVSGLGPKYVRICVKAGSQIIA